MSALSRAVVRAGGAFAFQRSAHHGWRRVAAASIAVNVMLAATLAGYVHFHSTVYITVFSTPDGRVIEAQRLDQPIRTDAWLKNWVTGAVTESLTLGHHDWQMRLSAVREYFSDRGYEEFVEAFRRGDYLERLLKGRQEASAVVQGVPVITDTRLLSGGRWGWELEFPMLITFHAGRDKESRRFAVKVRVARVPLDERIAGVAIEQIIATKVRGV